MSDRHQRERARQLRHERKREALGDPDPACLLCGYDNPVGLEIHHVAGAANSDVTIWLCKNCHAEMSDAQIDDPRHLYRHTAHRDPLTRTAAMLLNLSHLSAAADCQYRNLAAILLTLSQNLRAEHGDDWPAKLSRGKESHEKRF